MTTILRNIHDSLQNAYKESQNSKILSTLEIQGRMFRTISNGILLSARKPWPFWTFRCVMSRGCTHFSTVISEKSLIQYLKIHPLQLFCQGKMPCICMHSQQKNVFDVAQPKNQFIKKDRGLQRSLQNIFHLL